MIDLAIAIDEVAPPRGSAHVTKTLMNVTSILIADMPHCYARVITKAIRERRGERRRTFPIDSRTGAVLLARAESEAHTAAINRKRLRVMECHPRWR